MILKKNNKFEIIQNFNIENISKFDVNWNIFDKIYCIHYLPYKERYEKITNELSALGILNLKQFEWYYTTPNKYYDFLLYDTQFSKKIHTQVNCTNINYTVNSYNLLQLAKDQGFNRILIIEDDVCFLKNKKLLSDIMHKFPIDYDIVNMEPFIAHEVDSKKLNMYYNSFNKSIIYDTGFIALSKNAINKMIDADQKLLLPFDGYFTLYTDCSLKCAYSKIPVCIQTQYEHRQDQFISDKKYRININDYE